MKHLLFSILAASLCAASLHAEAPVATPPGAVWAESGTITLHFAIGFQRGVDSVPAGFTAIDETHADIRVPIVSGSINGNLFGVRYSHAVGETGGGSDLPFSQALLVGNPSTANGPLDEVPDGFAFTGATAGGTLWNLEQGNVGGMIYLGINSAGTDLSKLVAWNPGQPDKFAGYLNKFIQIRLQAVRGPGHFSLWQDGDELNQPVVYMSSFMNGVDAQDALFTPAGGHDHFNWSFTQPGRYEVDWQVGTFLVVPEPGTGALLALGSLLFFRRSRRASAARPIAF